MGGRDKTRELVGGVSVLELLLNALPDDWAVCCVGQPRPTDRPVLWTRERPAGGGPVAASMRGCVRWRRTAAMTVESAVTVVLARTSRSRARWQRPWWARPNASRG
ncbi:MAG: hypothetical protein IPM90_16025 [Austwickia sp.]|nr:hypothetical protein [Austwickia sp.]